MPRTTTTRRKAPTRTTRARAHLSKLDASSIAKLSGPPVFNRPSPRHKLEWTWIGSDGDPWPEWLRGYKKMCGVYAIKQRGEVVYVGSSKSALYDTVTRHFQQWTRQKKFWKGLKGAGHDPGMTYRRKDCQVAVYTVACGKEREEEARLIARFAPRDNIMKNPDGLEDAPF